MIEAGGRQGIVGVLRNLRALAGDLQHSDGTVLARNHIEDPHRQGTALIVAPDHECFEVTGFDRRRRPVQLACDKAGGSGLMLIELAPGVTLTEVEARTDAAFVAKVPE